MRSLSMYLVALGIAAMGSAHGASQQFSASVGYTLTDFDAVVGISKFDPSLGSLTGITFALTGSVSGDVGIYTYDNSSISPLAQLQAAVTLFRPDNSLLVTTLPVEQFQTTLGANPAGDPLYYFAVADAHPDDLAGTYAALHPGSVFHIYSGASDTQSATTHSVADYSLFTGSGSILLPITATGLSETSSSGNFIIDFDSSAKAALSVTYNYAPIPEPESWALMLSGLWVVGWLSARRRASNRP